MTVLGLIFVAQAEPQPLFLLHLDLASIFQRHHHTACWEIARHFDSARSFPHILRIYTKSTATPTYHRNFALAVFFSGRKFQNMPW